jgi:hypothetical protein
MSDDTRVITCLNDGNEASPCEGVVEFHPALPVRWHNSGAMVQFPRCAEHYMKYCDAHDERQARDERHRASLYCEHGTYIGDAWGPDYLCGRCESE